MYSGYGYAAETAVNGVNEFVSDTEYYEYLDVQNDSDSE